MANTPRIEKVRIQEKDFPANIPYDIGHKPLQVVNETDDTIALFYDISFLKSKSQDPLEYVREYDDIFSGASDIFSNSENTAEIVEEWCRKHPAFELSSWQDIDDTSKVVIAFCRCLYWKSKLHPFGVITVYEKIMRECNLEEFLEAFFTLDDVEVEAQLWNFFLEEKINNIEHDLSMAVEYQLILQNKFPDKILVIPGNCVLGLRFQIKEKDFLANIPASRSGYFNEHQPLKVINEQLETIAVFFDTSFIKRRFKDPLEYINHYDAIFDYWDIWQMDYWREEGINGAGWNESEEEKVASDEGRDKRIAQGPDFDWNAFEQLRYYGRALVALGRLSYPYHLYDYKKVETCLNAHSGEIIHRFRSCRPLTEGSNAGKRIINQLDGMV